MKIFGLLLLPLLFSCNGKEPASEIKPGMVVPVFSVSSGSGEVFSSDKKGIVKVVVFFNTKCPDCRRELPVIQELFSHYKDNGNVAIAPIAREQTAEEIERYWKTAGFTMPFYPVGDRSIYELFCKRGIPKIYISDRENIVKYVYEEVSVEELIKKTDGLL